MAYPTVSGPYGFKPVNLIGGQVFSGSTRNIPIAYGYTANIFYGDFVQITSGYATLLANDIAGAAAVGVFLGCSYTNPTTKQKLFSQYWPTGTLAGDAVAIVCDDPDTVFKAAVTTGAALTAIGSASSLLVGRNLAGNTVVGSTSTGNSNGAIVGSTPATSTGNFRIMNLVPDTQVSTSATYVSGGAPAATAVVVSGLAIGQVIPVGTDVFNLVGGQLQFTGASVSVAATVSSTTAQSLTVTAVATQVAGTVALVQTPEVLVKITFGSHRYYVA